MFSKAFYFCVQDFSEVAEKCKYEGYKQCDETVQHFWDLVKVQSLTLHLVAVYNLVLLSAIAHFLCYYSQTQSYHSRHQ